MQLCKSRTKYERSMMMEHFLNNGGRKSPPGVMRFIQRDYAEDKVFLSSQADWKMIYFMFQMLNTDVEMYE